MRAHLRTISERPTIEQISVFWYCVLSQLPRRVQPDIDMIRELDAAGLLVILVLTRVAWSKNRITGKRSAPDAVTEFQEWLKEPVDGEGRSIDIPIQRVTLTSTASKHGMGNGHGLGELVAETLTLSPDNQKDASRIAQRLNLSWKQELARPVITGAASAAAGATAVPVPVADAMILAPIQLAMMRRVAAIYDLELTTMMSAGALVQLDVQISGQALARSFLELLPGAGSVINAGVAFAPTAATGEAWLRLCEKVHTGKIDVLKVTDSWSDYAPGGARCRTQDGGAARAEALTHWWCG